MAKTTNTIGLSAPSGSTIRLVDQYNPFNLFIVVGTGNQKLTFEVSPETMKRTCPTFAQKYMDVSTAVYHYNYQAHHWMATLPSSLQPSPVETMLSIAHANFSRNRQLKIRTDVPGIYELLKVTRELGMEHLCSPFIADWTKDMKKWSLNLSPSWLVRAVAIAAEVGDEHHFVHWTRKLILDLQSNHQGQLVTSPGERLTENSAMLQAIFGELNCERKRSCPCFYPFSICPRSVYCL